MPLSCMLRGDLSNLLESKKGQCGYIMKNWVLELTAYAIWGSMS